MDWRRIPSLAALRAFEAQARLGGFTAAARELNITQAAVAQHVRRLEDFFSCALVQRQGRSMGLTDKGHRLTGTLTDEALLDERQENLLCAVSEGSGGSQGGDAAELENRAFAWHDCPPRRGLDDVRPHGSSYG